MRHLQIIPKKNFNIYGALVKKELSLRSGGKGTFRRSATGRWIHERYYGWVKFERGLGNVVNVELKSRVQDSEWQLLSAFIGFLDRHYSSKISALNIQYGGQ